MSYVVISRVFAFVTLPAIAAAWVPASAPASSGDFNRDGYHDLAVGVPLEDVNGALDAGAVNVLYGGENGASGTGADVFHQDVSGMLGKAEGESSCEGCPQPRGDYFGQAAAAGDFDADGFDDLAVGIPTENWPAPHGTELKDAGAVAIVYGTEDGLTTVGNQVISQATPGLVGVQRPEETFGSALAVGDLNGDGIDDLAVGIPYDTAPVGDDRHYMGGVNVIFGAAGTGLSASGSILLQQGANGIAGKAEAFDRFGASLAAGSFHEEGPDSLAVGAPGENAGAGAVNVIPGGPSGPSGTDDGIFTQNTQGIMGYAEKADFFGDALATGDFDASGTDDLAVSATNEARGTSVGAVHSIYSDGLTGLQTEGNQLWHQDVQGVQGAEDGRGEALAAGDLDKDGDEELAFGNPRDSIPDKGRVGSVNILFGAPDGGLSSANDLFFSGPSSENPSDPPDPGRLYGSALTIAQFGNNAFGSGYGDLAIGAPKADTSTREDVGFVHLIYGSSIGFAAAGDPIRTQDTPGVPGTAETDDAFGAALGVR